MECNRLSVSLSKCRVMLAMYIIRNLIIYWINCASCIVFLRDILSHRCSLFFDLIAIGRAGYTIDTLSAQRLIEMSRLNNFLKFVLINLNIIVSFVGLTLFGFSFYLWFADWGSLDKGFFKGIGAIVFLFSLCVILSSFIGCQGIANQTVKFSKPR